MKRWTIKELEELGDISFAIAILSERVEKLNPYTPLAEKIKKAKLTLDKVRGGLPQIPSDEEWEVIQERAFREKECHYLVEDLKIHMNNEGVKLHGMTPVEVAEDEEIMDEIVRRFQKCETGRDYWCNMEYVIDNGISYILEMRGEKA